MAKYRPVYVTEITDGLHVYTQDVETGEYESLVRDQYRRNYNIQYK